MTTDRIFGAVVTLVALAFIVSAYNSGRKHFRPGRAEGLSHHRRHRHDPVRRDAGSQARSGTGLAGGTDLLALGVATVVLVGYAYALKPLGFLLPTAIAAAVLSYQISPARCPPFSPGSACRVGLFIIFKYALGLSLFALPRSLIG